MINLNTNLSSLITQRSLAKSTLRLNQAIEQMTTGFKINHAKDNAANYNITTNMTTKIGAYMVAEDNCAMGLDLLATANGSLDQIADKLQRLRALAVQTSNGTYGEKSKEAINQEANAIVDEIERIYNTTEYNGINVMKGQVTGVEEGKFIKDIDRRDTSRMTTLASVDPDKALTSGIYSISTPEELAKLATMTNDGLVGAGTEFVLGADIDLSGYSAGEGWVPIGTLHRGAANPREITFYGDFDGNGYVISGLCISRASDNQGLFGAVSKSEIKNVAIVDATISLSGATTTIRDIAILTGFASESNIQNCYVTGVINEESHGTLSGGLVGQAYSGTRIDSCYSEVEINSGKWDIGGLVGNIQLNSSMTNSFAIVNFNNINSSGALAGLVFDNSFVENCYAVGNINNATKCGGLITSVYTNSYIRNVWTDVNITGSNNSGLAFSAAGAVIEQAYLLSENSNYKSLFVNEYRNNKTGDVIVKNCYYSDFYEGLGIPIGNIPEVKESNVNSYSGGRLFEFDTESLTKSYRSNMDIQVGSESKDSSRITIFLDHILGHMDSLRNIGNKSLDSLSVIDNTLVKVSDLQIQYGAAQNRLESALDEISVQYENLVSSRSTLRDADISEVSSEYIRQQILQQASATLMATANQSPSIALQLI